MLSELLRPGSGPGLTEAVSLLGSWRIGKALAVSRATGWRRMKGQVQETLLSPWHRAEPMSRVSAPLPGTPQAARAARPRGRRVVRVSLFHIRAKCQNTRSTLPPAFFLELEGEPSSS